MELLQGEFENKMYTIDMNSQLELTALMIPRPGTLPVPLVRTLYLFDKCLLTSAILGLMSRAHSSQALEIP